MEFNILSNRLTHFHRFNSIANNKTQHNRHCYRLLTSSATSCRKSFRLDTRLHEYTFNESITNIATNPNGEWPATLEDTIEWKWKRENEMAEKKKLILTLGAVDVGCERTTHHMSHVPDIICQIVIWCSVSFPKFGWRHQSSVTKVPFCVHRNSLGLSNPMTSMSFECNGRKAGETRTSAAYAIVRRLTPCHIISKKFFSKIFNCIKTENGSTPLPDGRTSQITCIFLKMPWHRTWTWTAGFVRRWQPVPYTHGVYIICIYAEFGKTRQTAWCSVLTLIFNVSDGRNVRIFVSVLQRRQWQTKAH